MEERKQVLELKQLSFWKWSYVGGSLVKFEIGKLIAVQIFAIAVRILQSRAIRKLLLSVLAENAEIMSCGFGRNLPFGGKVLLHYWNETIMEGCGKTF